MASLRLAVVFVASSLVGGVFGGGCLRHLFDIGSNELDSVREFDHLMTPNERAAFEASHHWPMEATNRGRSAEPMQQEQPMEPAGTQNAPTEEIAMMDWACSKKQREMMSCGSEEMYYRTFSGYCNNMKHPLWGASFTQQSRLVDAAYADRVESPRGGWTSSQAHCCTGSYPGYRSEKELGSCAQDPTRLLPNPRTVRKHFHSTSQAAMADVDPNVSLLFTLFGQFLDHDITLTPALKAFECCQGSKESSCFAYGDPFMDQCTELHVCKERIVQRITDTEMSEVAQQSSAMTMADDTDDGEKKKNSKLEKLMKKLMKRKNTMAMMLDLKALSDEEKSQLQSMMDEMKTRQMDTLTELTNYTCDSKMCFDFERSAAFCGDQYHLTLDSQSSCREQSNAITAFVDASNVYGSDAKRAAMLREAGTPYLRTSTYSKLLPDITGSMAFAGDERSAEQPALTTLHTLFVREHNRIAAELEELVASNRQWKSMLNKKNIESSEAVFQLARRVVVAEMQAIVYGQYLKTLLGTSTIREMRLRASGDKTFTYSPYTDPTITNEFSTAAFRFGHTMVQGIIEKRNLMDGNKTESFSLADNFFDTTHYKKANGSSCDEILYGEYLDHSQNYDPFLDEVLAEQLFINENGFGDDLGARNIQRGRDHGLAGYNEYRELCDMPRACSWDEAPEEIDAAYWKTLSEVYDHPSDIDLFTAGLAEKPHAGGVVGRTFNCIIGKQFKALMYGDRFFYSASVRQEDNSKIPVLTADELKNIHERTLSDVLCDNLDIDMVRKNAFKLDSEERECSMGNKMNLRYFVKGEIARLT